MPARKKTQGPPDGTRPLALTDKQRVAMLEAVSIWLGLARKLETAAGAGRSIDLSREELERLGEEVHGALQAAPSAGRRRLEAVLEKIDEALDDLDDERVRERRRDVGTAGPVYRLKVTLKGSKPPIWRRIEVPDCTLGRLHEVIQVAMGWMDCHLHQFKIGGRFYTPSPDEDADFGMDAEDEEEMTLGRLASAGGKVRFTYEYDFGDSWEHEVILEKTVDADPALDYPRCVAGARACPPEDVGGVWGYADFVEAIADPEHDRHDDLLEWIGGGPFDPDAFSLEQVNADLRKEYPSLG